MKIRPGTIQCLLDDKEFAYQTGVALRGFSVTRKSGEWQAIFRGVNRKGENVYCLYVAVDLETSLEGLFRALMRKDGSRYWYPDKYAK